MPRNDEARTAVFAVTADRCPQLLCRLLGLVAQQDRLAEWVRVESAPRSYRISLGIAEIDAHRAEILSHKMRSMVSVRTVRLSFARAERALGDFKHVRGI